MFVFKKKSQNSITKRARICQSCIQFSKAYKSQRSFLYQFGKKEKINYNLPLYGFKVSLSVWVFCSEFSASRRFI